MPEIDEESRTIFCGNLSDQVSEELLFELFLQAGPLDRVHIPKDPNGRQRSFGFVTYAHVTSVPYALNLYNGTKLFNREIQIKPRNSNSNGINNNLSQNSRTPLLLSSSLPSMRIPDISSLRFPGGSNPFRNSAMIPSTSLSYGPSLPKHLSNMQPTNNSRRGGGDASGISRKNEICNEGININFLLKSAPQLLQTKNAGQSNRDFSLNKDGNNKNMPRNDNQSKNHRSNRGGGSNDYKQMSRSDNKLSNRNDGPYNNSGSDRYGRRGNSPIPLSSSSSSSRGGGGYDRKHDDRHNSNRRNGRRR